MKPPPPRQTNPPPPKNSAGLLVKLVLPLLALAALFLIYQWFWLGGSGISGGSGGSGGLVVYCSQDEVFAQEILARFTKETGIPVVAKYDTEATKSLGLTQLLLAHKENPGEVCDVFWNNELLGTLDLADQGMLEPYKGPGYERIPQGCKDKDGRWAGFAARLRVYIVNTHVTDLINQDGPVITGRLRSSADTQPTPLVTSLNQITSYLARPDLSRFAFAEPLYGTTLTQFCVMWRDLGPDKLKAWRDDTLKRGSQVVRGNAVVKDLVAKGVCDLGMTDTDDYFDAVDDKAPVTMTPIFTADGKAICIPNTVAILKGTPRIDAARKLVDFLLSEKVELELAQGKSRQIPLGKADETQLPEQVRQLRPWVAKATDLYDLGPARKACLEWLQAGEGH